MANRFTYLSQPVAYIVETSKRAYMVVEGHSQKKLSSSKRRAGEIRSLSRTHQVHKCGKHSSRSKQKTKRSQKRAFKDEREDHTNRNISFNQYGIRPNCNYNSQLQDENQCLRVENKCLQQYIRVLEERCNSAIRPEPPKSFVYEQSRKRTSSREGSCFDENKLFSTKGTASWISHQN